MNDRPWMPASTNLSSAWAESFLHLMGLPRGRMEAPLVVSIDDFDELGRPVEQPQIRSTLDQAIDRINGAAGSTKIQRVSDTACTIFPHMCWSPTKPRPAADLFERYEKGIWPRLKRRSSLNSRGTYFLRMISSTGVSGPGHSLKKVNQLEEILRWWHRDGERGRRTRRSALQASIYDPAKDHNGSALSKFPCLQQVSFGPTGHDLMVAAYYPTEYVFDRGYGNYFGLCRLGAFMAHEMGLRLSRLDVFVAAPTLGNVSKGKLQDLARELRALVPPESPTALERATEPV